MRLPIRNRVIMGADGTPYTYDSVRKEWLGPPMVVVANNTSSASTMYLRYGNQISSSSRGWLTPFALKIVGGTISSGASATADLQARVGGSSQGVVVALAAATTGSSSTADINIAAGVQLALYLTASVGTPDTIIASIIIRQRMA